MQWRWATTQQEETLVSRRKWVTGLVFACLLALGACRSGMAQSADDVKKLQEDVATLKKDVKAIKEQQQEILKQLEGLRLPQRPGAVSVKGEPFLGESAARVAIIDYGDYQCPFCGRYTRAVYPQIVANYVKTGKVRYYYRDLPLSIHPHAMPAALAARCAGEQGKFWPMHDALFADQTDLTAKGVTDRAGAIGLDLVKLAECVSSAKYAAAIRESASGADKMGIDGTPTFLLGIVEANGDVIKVNKTIEGAESYEVFRSDLDELLTSEKQ